jgi:hypothetical protein
MYKEELQLKLEDFVFPYGQLDAENDWVKLAQLIPWESIAVCEQWASGPFGTARSGGSDHQAAIAVQ